MQRESINFTDIDALNRKLHVIAGKLIESPEKYKLSIECKQGSILLSYGTKGKRTECLEIKCNAEQGNELKEILTGFVDAINYMNKPKTTLNELGSSANTYTTERRRGGRRASDRAASFEYIYEDLKPQFDSKLKQTPYKHKLPDFVFVHSSGVYGQPEYHTDVSIDLGKGPVVWDFVRVNSNQPPALFNLAIIKHIDRLYDDKKLDGPKIYVKHNGSPEYGLYDREAAETSCRRLHPSHFYGYDEPSVTR